MRCRWTRVKCAQMYEKLRGVRMFCPHTLSCKVDHFQLQTKPTVTKKRDSSKKKLCSHFQFYSDTNLHEEPGDEGQYCHPICWSTRAMEKYFFEYFLSLLFVFVDLGGWDFQFVSPGSWCKRFSIITPTLYSDQKFVSSFLHVFFGVKYIMSFFWTEFVCFFRKFIPLFAFLSKRTKSELWFTINWNGSWILVKCWLWESILLQHLLKEF